MGENVKPVYLNLGCGLNKLEGWINVDGFPICNPDVLWDLNKTPWPWRNTSVDSIYMNHVMEHLIDWLAALKECARILKYGGTLHVNVPDHTSTASVGYIDHLHVFSMFSFHMCAPKELRGTNAWAISQEVVPLVMTQCLRVPQKEYVKWWIPKKVLLFCCDHLTNFCREQRFTFIKVNPDREEVTSKMEQSVTIDTKGKELEGDGMQFYRCILCGHVVSVWDIREHHGCPKCKNPRIKPSELSGWEKIVELVKHPRFWKWDEVCL